MAVSLTVLIDPRDAARRRELQVAPGTTILEAAHAASIDITATCGRRGRCTSCRVKFLAGPVPPATIMDEVQLGADLVREGYRLSCQCRVTEPVTVQVAPPLDEQAFQILGPGTGGTGLRGVPIASGVAKQLLKEDLLEDPLIQLCLGIPWGALADTTTIKAMADNLPPGITWAAFGIGRMQMPMVAQAMLLGGNDRLSQ